MPFTGAKVKSLKVASVLLVLVQAEKKQRQKEKLYNIVDH